MLQKLFGGKKKKDYFLEVKEGSTISSPSTPTETKGKKTDTSVVEEVVEEAVENQDKTEKKSKKSAKKAKSAPKAEPKPSAPVAAQNNGKMETVTEFATKYLIMPTSGRRRPGPSLNTFKSMARQMKTPRK